MMLLYTAGDISNLLNKMARLELSLRTDVGIYEIDELEARYLHLSYDDINFKTLGKRYRTIKN